MMDRSSAESLYLETRGLGVMARGLLVGVTCDMFLSIFRRDRDTEKIKYFLKKEKYLTWLVVAQTGLADPSLVTDHSQGRRLLRPTARL